MTLNTNLIKFELSPTISSKPSMSTQESEDLEEPKPWIISNTGRILGVITFIMIAVKLGQTENLSFLRFFENQTGENEPVYWILVFGMLLELAAIFRLFHLVIRINRRRHLLAASFPPNSVPEISNSELRSIEASPDTTLVAGSDEDKVFETQNEFPDKIEVELQNGNEFELLSDPKQDNGVELQPKIIKTTQSFHAISEEIVSETTR